jgi:hypothetical protein
MVKVVATLGDKTPLTQTRTYQACAAKQRR